MILKTWAYDTFLDFTVVSSRNFGENIFLDPKPYFMNVNGHTLIDLTYILLDKIIIGSLRTEKTWKKDKRWHISNRALQRMHTLIKVDKWENFYQRTVVIIFINSNYTILYLIVTHYDLLNLIVVGFHQRDVLHDLLFFW